MTAILPTQTPSSTSIARYPAGFDGGNTDSCFSAVDSNGQEVTIVIPSAIAQASADKLELFRSAVHGVNVAQDLYRSDFQVTYQGTNYYVGYLALRQAKRASTQKGDEARYTSQEQLIRLLATSALALPDARYEIDLVTTVPVATFSKKLRLAVRNTFEGTHEFTLNGAERQATIHVRKVMVEGPPALVLYGANSAGQRRIILDGGGYTTDFTFLDGNDPIPDLCKGVNLGVENVGDQLAEAVYEQHGRRLTLKERSDILRAYGSRNTARPLPYPEIACGTYVLPPQELVGMLQAGCQRVANETLAEARALWGMVNDVVAGDVVHQYHIGGSALFYNDLLRVKMPKLLPVTQAAQANARGSARIAQALQ